ncbi:HAMP domain-containing histidine kinase [Hymenobacter sp. BT18]|uniref:sensor histidine kinase n=1 Tax=Hymenobacter sp. BT18 TaxID=2835648 RepID=UPI00143E4F86|nr:HAMP domain-containing sensor histidine kinase [Hymenobacter sp. BT18]QIX60668.1 HAMP domain-containing histidine kinase [Hymenobacter sp. BT18]
MLAAGCFAAAYISNHYGLATSVLLRAEARQLQNLVRTAEHTAEQEGAKLAADLQRDPPSFSRLLQGATYPTFVFEKLELRYWSDHMMRPEVENALQPFQEKVVEMKFGRYLALRQPAGPYVLLTYVPLEKYYGISNRYLREGATQALFRGLSLRIVTNDPSGLLPRIYSARGTYLFSLESLHANPVTGKFLPAGLLLLGIVLYLLGWLLLAQRWFTQQRRLRGAAAVVLPLVALRAALLYWGLPFSFIELPLFDPRVYAASAISPSLGDLLLNALVMVVVAVYGLRLFRRYGVLRRIGRLHRDAARVAVGTGAVLAFYALLITLYQFYASTFTNSQLNLDITQSIQVSTFKLLLLLAIVLHTGGYLLALYLLTQCFVAIVRPATKGVAVLLLAGSALVFTPVGLLLSMPYITLLGLTLIFFLILRLTGLRPLAAVVPYQLYLLVFLMVGLSAAIGSLALYMHFDRQLIQNKQKMASNLLVDNDLQGEFLLTERTRQMAADPFIQARITGPFGNQDVVRQKIEKYYLRDYFDKYETNVLFFDVAGQRPGATNGVETLAAARSRLLRNAVQTDQSNLYLVHDGATFSSRRYVTFVPVQAASGGVATIVLELALKKLTTYSLVPELLVDEKFFQPGLGPELSYAGFEHDRPVYSEGDFDYVNNLRHQALHDPRLYTTGLVVAGRHHLGVRGPQERVVVVTTPKYSFGSWLANFSFLFLLHTFFWLLCVVGYMVVRGKYPRMLRTNFSTKIQLFLNLGILIPLLVVSVATASQVTASYKRDLLRTYERRGKAVQDNLLKNRALLADSVNRTQLAETATTVASLTETDLNLYDSQGQLLVSSQPLIFESGLLSPLMNPQAMKALAERSQPRILLSERAGTLSFNALYLPLRVATATPGAGAVLGYVGIPFFDSEKELDTKLIELVDTILNIFTVMFILFLILTFIASRYLTAPLKLLTEKLKHTTLTGQNEMLTYESSDEIGLLVREYNTMLRKLEESKQELAAQEKEAAWREMARQVAHEIKNPLTPMKLSLQFLQRAIQDGRADLSELIGRVSQTLITQIDVLTDIATSFSNFTNLPAMRPERLDVAAVLRRCVGLHQGNGQVRLQLPPEAEEHGYIVYADESLLVRTFNNLLINALQAVPEGQRPEVEARIERVGAGKVRIAIEDNGTGIPAEVQEKIFVPNFTTKEKGSGIGLAVARRGIESAGGSIWFETREGEGTTFYIELPLAG